MTDKKYTWDDVELLVVGAGTMGASIAQAYAQNGFVVGLIDIADEILDTARETIAKELDGARGRIFTDDEIIAIQERILTTTDYPTACGGKKLKIAIESATERLDIKTKIFQQLDELCAPDVVLATNSSSLNTNILSDAVKRSDKVVWMHYFYLPHKNRGGEVAGTDAASKDAIRTGMYYMKMGGKVSTPITSSRKGGAADILFVALLLEACRMVDEGFDKGDVEAGARAAFNLPMGFLALMDATGIAIGLYAMESFADNSDPDDPLFKVYKDFFKPTDGFRALVEEQLKAEDPSTVRWLPVEGPGPGTGDEAVVNQLKERFLAIAFMSAFEIVDAGVITPEDFEILAKNAFLWRAGPFTFFNKYGIKEGWRMVQDRASLAKKDGYHFPIPANLKALADAGSDLELKMNPIEYETCEESRIAWITLNSPTTANALDDFVFDMLEEAFAKANADDNVDTIVFDTAPIKTFIAGANVPKFVENMEAGRFDAIREGTARWQDIMFHKMTGSGKPKVAIVDGQAFGGGVETAMAFAWDPDTIVIATNHTSYALPETRLGIFPGLRGTLMMSRIIHRTTGDADLALAMARYYILAGGTATSSQRLLRYFGLADLVVPSNTRDEVAVRLCRAISENGGKALTRDQIDALEIEEIPTALTLDDKEEIHYMKHLFLKADLIPTLYAHGRRDAVTFHTSPWREQVIRIANRAAANSPNAVWVSNWLISKGFDDYLKGVDLDESAAYELNQHLEEIFRHPDASVGLKAMLARKFPEFPRRYPL